MTPERVLQHSPLVLDQRQRERYFADGFLAVPRHIGTAWLDRLRAVVAAKIDESRVLTASDDQFDLAPNHSAEKPNIRRLRKAIDQHPELWTFATDPSVVDLVADLLGPAVRCYCGIDEETAAVVDGILATSYLTRRLSVDREKLASSDEAWIYVIVGPHEGNDDRQSFHGYPSGVGVLTWPNSD